MLFNPRNYSLLINAKNPLKKRLFFSVYSTTIQLPQLPILVSPDVFASGGNKYPSVRQMVPKEGVCCQVQGGGKCVTQTTRVTQHMKNVPQNSRRSFRNCLSSPHKPLIFPPQFLSFAVPSGVSRGNLNHIYRIPVFCLFVLFLLLLALFRLFLLDVSRKQDWRNLSVLGVWK